MGQPSGKCRPGSEAGRLWHPPSGPAREPTPYEGIRHTQRDRRRQLTCPAEAMGRWRMPPTPEVLSQRHGPSPPTGQSQSSVPTGREGLLRQTACASCSSENGVWSTRTLEDKSGRRRGSVLLREGRSFQEQEARHPQTPSHNLSHVPHRRPCVSRTPRTRGLRLGRPWDGLLTQAHSRGAARPGDGTGMGGQHRTEPLAGEPTLLRTRPVGAGGAHALWLTHTGQLAALRELGKGQQRGPHRTEEWSPSPRLHQS